VAGFRRRSRLRRPLLAIAQRQSASSSGSLSEARNSSTSSRSLSRSRVPYSSVLAVQMTGCRPLDRMICGILSRTSLPWLIAALPAVRGSCDPAITTNSGIVDARDLWIPENTLARSGYFSYRMVHRRDGNVMTEDERRLSSSLRRLSFSTVSTCTARANVSLAAIAVALLPQVLDRGFLDGDPLTQLDLAGGDAVARTPRVPDMRSVPIPAVASIR
jgi:hypothetical protein